MKKLLMLVFLWPGLTMFGTPFSAGAFTITNATNNMKDSIASAPIEFVAPVKNDPNSDNVILYPNPNNGHFSIDFVNFILNDKSEIIITDLSGRQVYRGPVLKEELSKQFDLPDLKMGTYVMMIRDKEILLTKKFIRE